MTDVPQQHLKNHAKFDPSFHFLLFFILVVNLVVVLAHLVHHILDIYAWWLVILSMGFFIMYFKIRMYPLKVQDRVIRLEERLRLQALAPEEWHARIYHLTEDQLIGLRFASDDEVVELAEIAITENLTRKQIKERVKSWRADHWRI